MIHNMDTYSTVSLSLSPSLHHHPDGSAKAERQQVYSLYISLCSFKRFNIFQNHDCIDSVGH